MSPDCWISASVAVLAWNTGPRAASCTPLTVSMSLRMGEVSYSLGSTAGTSATATRLPTGMEGSHLMPTISLLSAAVSFFAVSESITPSLKMRNGMLRRRNSA